MTLNRLTGSSERWADFSEDHANLWPGNDEIHSMAAVARAADAQCHPVHALKSPQPLQARAGALRILIVEDHRDTADVLRRLLEHHDHVVRIAATLAEADQVCREWTFDLALCDIGLPDGDGCDLAPTLKACCPNARLIALTSYGMTHEVAQILAAGFDAHVLKPVQFDAILNQLPSGCATAQG